MRTMRCLQAVPVNGLHLAPRFSQTPPPPSLPLLAHVSCTLPRAGGRRRETWSRRSTRHRRDGRGGGGGGNVGGSKGGGEPGGSINNSLTEPSISLRQCIPIPNERSDATNQTPPEPRVCPSPITIDRIARMLPCAFRLYQLDNPILCCTFLFLVRLLFIYFSKGVYFGREVYVLIDWILALGLWGEI